jgi:hypothetical protein
MGSDFGAQKTKRKEEKNEKSVSLKMFAFFIPLLQPYCCLQTMNRNLYPNRITSENKYMIA